MTSRLFIYPYRDESRSARALGQALGALRIRREGSRFQPSADKVVINWGNSSLPAGYATCRVLNRPEAVARVSNKRTFFETCASTVNGPRTPDWTTSVEEAVSWWTANSRTRVFVRTVLSGHSGEGIVVAESPGELAPFRDGTLFVKECLKRDEFRVHLVGATPFLVQKKARNTTVPDELVNWKVRNHANGFIYARENVSLPNGDCLEQCVKAMSACGLDFGAVDVLYNERQQQSFVLEINSAPGMEGHTAIDYANAIGGHLNAT